MRKSSNPKNARSRAMRLGLLVYHRLLDACFIEGLFLEERYPWLPPLRHNIKIVAHGQQYCGRT
jgi:hypothetical protein